MSVLWDRLIDCQHEIIDLFEKHGEETAEPGLDSFNKPESGWINRVWINDSVRRAHIDVVDARETKRLWMMHVCCFPVLGNNAPIYGFDVIAGQNKITGAFHDFSPLFGAEEGDLHHPLQEWYAHAVEEFVPSKKRTLPEWAQNIFSPEMIAAGNVRTEDEAVSIIDLALENLSVWFESVPQYNNTMNPDQTVVAHDYYSINQQQNPHTANVMKSLGLDPDSVDTFCRDMLFPKIA